VHREVEERGVALGGEIVEQDELRTGEESGRARINREPIWPRAPVMTIFMGFPWFQVQVQRRILSVEALSNSTCGAQSTMARSRSAENST